MIIALTIVLVVLIGFREVERRSVADERQAIHEAWIAYTNTLLERIRAPERSPLIQPVLPDNEQLQIDGDEETYGQVGEIIPGSLNGDNNG